MRRVGPGIVILGLAALSASLALLMARLGLPVAADVLAICGAALGMTAFLVMVVATVRSARRLPERPGR